MDLKIYLDLLWRRRWVIVLTLVVTLAIAVVGTLLATPQYRSSVLVRVATTTSGQAEWSDTVYAGRLMNTYVEIITSRPTEDQLGIVFGYEEPPVIDVEILSNTELMSITVEDTNPVRAAEAANYLAGLLVDETLTVREFRGNPAFVVEPAAVPDSPSSPNTILNLALGAFAGIAAGLGLAFFFENIDQTLQTNQEIEQLVTTPTLAKIPSVWKWTQDGKAFMNGSSPEGEAFRRLRTNILSLQKRAPLKALMVASAEPNEGKSTTTVNLAYSIAQSGNSVLVVDGDMRRPKMHDVFHLPNEAGLTDVLERGVPAEDVIQETSVPGISLLASGNSDDSPAELLTRPRMAEFLEEVREAYDFVLLDTPALIAVADASIIAPVVDGVLFVVTRTQSQENLVREAWQELEIVNANMVGLVINKSESARRTSRYSYYRN